MKNLLKIVFVIFVLLGTASAADVVIYKSGLVTIVQIDAPLCEEYDDLVAMGRRVAKDSYRLTIDDVYVGNFYFDQNDEYIGSYYEFGYPELFYGSMLQIKGDKSAPEFLRALAKEEISKTKVRGGFSLDNFDFSLEKFNKIAQEKVLKLKQERENSL